MSQAAISITLFLVVLILLLLVVIGGAIAGGLAWRRYQRRERLREAIAQARIYALLQGRTPATRRPAVLLPPDERVG